MCLCSHLTALGIHHTTRCDGDESIDEDIAALVDALPQLLALDPGHRAVLASNTGLLYLRTGNTKGLVACRIGAVPRASMHVTPCTTLCTAMHAGIAQLSKLRQMQHLDLVCNFTGCGLTVALATMTGAIVSCHRACVTPCVVTV